MINMINIKKFNLDKFKTYLLNNGAELLPLTNEYEYIRYKGKLTEVIYKTGKFSSIDVNKTIEDYKCGNTWRNRPIKIDKRSSNYNRKQKLAIIKRDGENCFYCDLPLNGDISLEHLVSLVSGGTNNLGNSVVCHKNCNNEAGNLTVKEKIDLAIKKRLKN